MGRSVNLWKLSESESDVTYLYGASKEQAGSLVINKVMGTVSSRDPVPGMTEQESWFLYSMLAKAKAEKMLLKKEYPDEDSLSV